jgi:hypothetical protein
MFGLKTACDCTTVLQHDGERHQSHCLQPLGGWARQNRARLRIWQLCKFMNSASPFYLRMARFAATHKGPDRFSTFPRWISGRYQECITPVSPEYYPDVNQKVHVFELPWTPCEAFLTMKSINQWNATRSEELRKHWFCSHPGHSGQKCGCGSEKTGYGPALHVLETLSDIPPFTEGNNNSPWGNSLCSTS